MSKKIFSLLVMVIVLLNACDDSNQQDKNTADDSTKVKKNIPKVVKPEEVKSDINKNLTQQAKLIAGLDFDADDVWKKIRVKNYISAYNQQFNTQWKNLENKRLDKIIRWRDTELTSINSHSHNLLYPFSGPDLLNAYLFFPNCDNYLMFGLEPIGTIPDLKTKDDEYLKKYLSGIQRALRVIFQRNYFITSFMGGNLNKNNQFVQGVTPIITTFLARTNNDIIKIEKFRLEKDGKPKFLSIDFKEDTSYVYGLHIAFKNQQQKKSQHLYYFGTDVRESKMPRKPELLKFIRSFQNKIAFVKSASYLLHGYEFKTIRELILAETSAVLQDDTGIPYAFYVKEGWNVQLYGKYARPVAEPDFKNWYQVDLQNVYNQGKNIKPLDFTFGYHWNTDKTSVLLCTKNKK